MQPGELVAERFEVERVAGAGGMATVYRALDRRTGAPVALKVMRGEGQEDARARFAREAVVHAGVVHPNVVGYVAHGETADGEPWLAMEWLEGETLGERLGRAGLTVGESLALGAHVASALASFHALGVLHRDLKPSNIFLPDGAIDRAKVLDFGVARLATEQGLTLTGAMVGTPGFMAPEQARGDRDLDARADVYALGCILFRCLTGKAPFAADDPLGLLLKVVLEEAPRASELVPGLPPALDALVASMLAKSREVRPPSAAAVSEAIAAIGATHGPAARDAEPLALTGTERRVVCLVVVRIAGALAASEPTLPRQAWTAREDGIRGVVERFRGRIDRLADGSVVVAMTTAGAATDLAARAAQCALALRDLLPGAAIALVAGRAVLSMQVPMGEVIDRAVGLVAGRPAEGVRVDEVMAGLLDARFEVGGDAGGLTLRAERPADTARTLLGKPTPCVGRERELAALEATLEQCATEPMARAVLVTAPAGVGKSRLRHELLRRLQPSWQVWLGRGDPVGAGSPFGLLGHAVRRAAGVLEGEPAPVRRRKLRARVGRNVPEADLARVSEFVGELAGVPFDDAESVQLAAARRDPVLRRDQMQRAFEVFLRAETRAAPLLLVLEDLHWGDLPTIQLVDGALRALADRPFAVLALGRPEVRDLFPDLWSERELEEVRLGRLTRSGAERLIREVLGADLPAERVLSLVDRAEGNAFYLEELLRAVAEGRGDALPETVIAMAQARLERLGAESRRVLRAASVFGQVFWRGGVAALLGGAERAAGLPDELHALGQQEVLSRRASCDLVGDEEYVFRHALMRQAAYDMLTDADRELGHRLAGRWLEEAGEEDAIVLAEHLERGGEPARAAAWYARAAEQALGANDFRASLARAERALACGAEGELRGAVSWRQAEANRWLGRSPDARRAALDAMPALREGSDKWYAAAGEALIAMGKLTLHDELSTLTGRLLESEPEEAARAARLVALARGATQLLHAGRYDQAARVLAGVVGEVASCDEPIVRARVDQALAIRAMSVGDPASFMACMESSADAFEAAGDLRNACLQRGNVGYGCAEIGAYAEAEEALRRVIATAEQMNLPGVAAYSIHNLGMTVAHRGRFEEGLALEARAIEAFVRHGDRRLQGVSLIYRARIFHLAGDLEAAQREADLAVHTLEGLPTVLSYALGVRSQAFLLRGDAPRALADAESAMELYESLGGIEDGDALVRLAYAEALHATGQAEGARIAIDLARAHLLARAAKIGDAARRATFLEAVPDNTRTLELARAWGADA